MLSSRSLELLVRILMARRSLAQVTRVRWILSATRSGVDGLAQKRQLGERSSHVVSGGMYVE